MSFDGLLGAGGAAKQLLVYGVGYEIARALLGPLFTQIEYDINNNSPIVELTPPQIADLVVRGVITNEADAAKRAQVYGLSADKFQEMVDLAGEPPGLQQVLEMWRRGIVPTDAGIGAPSLNEAIRTSRIYSYWTDAIGKFQFQPVSPADLVDAVQRNQISEAEGVMLSYFAGLGNAENTLPAGANPQPTQDAFTILLNTRGNPPSPGELAELVRRQIIPLGNLDPAAKSPDPAATTFAQGIYEGDSKDKWLPMYAGLIAYLPPPRTIVAMLKQGSLTVAQGTDLLTKAGLTPDLVAAYINGATSTKLAKTKELSESNVITLLNDKLIDVPTAITFLEQLGYPTNEATALATTAQAAATITSLKANVSRIETAYLAHKVDRANALTLLTNLGLAGTEATAKVDDWDIIKQANIKVLTEAQIVDAWEYQVYTQAQAQQELQALGYTPYDAWTLLSVKAKQPLPNPPPFGPGLVQ